MKKLFFIPAILFIVISSFLISENVTSAPQTGVTIYFKDKDGNSISGPVAGCLNYINFSSSTGSANLGNVPPGTYGACAQGSGYYGSDTYVISGFTPMHITLTMHEGTGYCSCAD